MTMMTTIMTVMISHNIQAAQITEDTYYLALTSQ